MGKEEPMVQVLVVMVEIKGVQGAGGGDSDGN